MDRLGESEAQRRRRRDLRPRRRAGGDACRLALGEPGHRHRLAEALPGAGRNGDVEAAGRRLGAEANRVVGVGEGAPAQFARLPVGDGSHGLVEGDARWGGGPDREPAVADVGDRGAEGEVLFHHFPDQPGDRGRSLDDHVDGDLLTGRQLPSRYKAPVVDGDRDPLATGAGGRDALDAAAEGVGADPGQRAAVRAQARARHREGDDAEPGDREDQDPAPDQDRPQLPARGLALLGSRQQLGRVLVVHPSEQDRKVGRRARGSAPRLKSICRPDPAIPGARL